MAGLFQSAAKGAAIAVPRLEDVNPAYGAAEARLTELGGQLGALLEAEQALTGPLEREDIRHAPAVGIEPGTPVPDPSPNRS